jgi:DNA-binding transcriptional regulator/RsmH inhibitor MraZ
MPSTSIDDKGRLKLPAEVLTFLKAVGVSKVFITTMDLQSVRVYPVLVWDENVRLAEAETENPEVAEELLMRCRALGGEDEIDSAGKVLLPVDLRKRLGLDRQQVRLEVQQNGCVSVMSQQVFEVRFGSAVAAGTEPWKQMRKKGWK